MLGTFPNEECTNCGKIGCGLITRQPVRFSLCYECDTERVTAICNDEEQRPIGYKIKSLLVKKERALMIIVESIVNRHHQGHIFIDDTVLKLFEFAKRVHFATDEKSVQEVVEELINVLKE